MNRLQNCIINRKPRADRLKFKERDFKTYLENIEKVIELSRKYNPKELHNAGKSVRNWRKNNDKY